MTKIIALSNQKGGVGKTTTAVNLATGLAACGKKVLVIDFDPQGNTSTAFGIEKMVNTKNSYSLLMHDATLSEVVHKTNVPNLDVVPSTIHLSGAEVELVPVMARERRLEDALFEQVDVYDYVFIDCPPSLGLLTLNALTAATDVLVPLQCEFFAMEGLSQLFQTIDLVKKNLNDKLKLNGVLLTMFDTRNKLSSVVEEDVRRHLGDKVYKTMIPRNVRVSEAPSFGKPVLLHDVKCAGAQAYIKLAGEIIRRDVKASTAVLSMEVAA
ncbi:MAG: chromosome partitioning protein ParA [Magnetococcales bacterium]|nr:chromosome partitioning protein ParA [Magnetococcales bacterium]|tara:strand:- start:75 stop:878 length:804 start_codon:yes stop_codon:yes gene_type:complete